MVTDLKWVQESGAPINPKVKSLETRLPPPYPPKPKTAKLLAQNTVVKREPDHVAVCVGLPKRRYGCDWQVVSVHLRASEDARRAFRDAKLAAPDNVGVAMFLLDDSSVVIVEKFSDPLQRFLQ